MNPAPGLELANVTKTFPGATGPVLKQISLSVPAGEWAFLTGASGAGKSTLLKLLYGAVRADAGEVRVLGRDVAHTAAHRIRRDMGLVFQSFELLAGKSALENVAYGAEILGFPPKTARRRAEAMLAAVGLAEAASRLPNRLSGGEQQRVGIARALIHHPPVVLADEPTGNLDVDTARRIFDIMRAFHLEWRPTILMATHSRDLLEWAGGRVFALRDGTVQVDDDRPGAGEPS